MAVVRLHCDIYYKFYIFINVIVDKTLILIFFIIKKKIKFFNKIFLFI